MQQKSGAGLMRKNFLVIHNKMAGRLKAPMLTAVLKQLDQRGAKVRLEAAASVEEDIELARVAVALQNVDAVIAAGGDSTIRGVALGLKETDMPLGIIPAGTGNVLAQEIGLGKKAGKIAETLMQGTCRTIRMGLAQGEPFLLMAGAGFDAQIVRDLDHNLKQRIRKAAYVGPTLKALSGKPPHFTVSFEEDRNEQRGWHSYRAAFVVVTRARLYGGSFVIAPEADLGSKDLQVVMFMNKGRLGMVRSLLGLALGGNGKLKKTARDEQGKLVGHIMRTPGVMIRSAKSVRIESLAPFATQIDGDYLQTVPVRETKSEAGPVNAQSAPTTKTARLEISSDGGCINLIVPKV